MADHKPFDLMTDDELRAFLDERKAQLNMLNSRNQPQTQPEAPDLTVDPAPKTAALPELPQEPSVPGVESPAQALDGRDKSVMDDGAKMRRQWDSTGFSSHYGSSDQVLRRIRTANPDDPLLKDDKVGFVAAAEIQRRFGVRVPESAYAQAPALYRTMAAKAEQKPIAEGRAPGAFDTAAQVAGARSSSVAPSTEFKGTAEDMLAHMTPVSQWSPSIRDAQRLPTGEVTVPLTRAVDGTQAVNLTPIRANIIRAYIARHPDEPQAHDRAIQYAKGEVDRWVAENLSGGSPVAFVDVDPASSNERIAEGGFLEHIPGWDRVKNMNARDAAIDVASALSPATLVLNPLLKAATDALDSGITVKKAVSPVIALAYPYEQTVTNASGDTQLREFHGSSGYVPSMSWLTRLAPSTLIGAAIEAGGWGTPGQIDLIRRGYEQSQSSAKIGHAEASVLRSMGVDLGPTAEHFIGTDTSLGMALVEPSGLDVGMALAGGVVRAGWQAARAARFERTASQLERVVNDFASGKLGDKLSEAVGQELYRRVESVDPVFAQTLWAELASRLAADPRVGPGVAKKLGEAPKLQAMVGIAEAEMQQRLSAAAAFEAEAKLRYDAANQAAKTLWGSQDIPRDVKTLYRTAGRRVFNAAQRYAEVIRGHAAGTVTLDELKAAAQKHTQAQKGWAAAQAAAAQYVAAQQLKAAAQARQVVEAAFRKAGAVSNDVVKSGEHAAAVVASHIKHAAAVAAADEAVRRPEVIESVLRDGVRSARYLAEKVGRDAPIRFDALAAAAKRVEHGWEVDGGMLERAVRTSYGKDVVDAFMTERAGTEAAKVLDKAMHAGSTAPMSAADFGGLRKATDELDDFATRFRGNVSYIARGEDILETLKKEGRLLPTNPASVTDVAIRGFERVKSAFDAMKLRYGSVGDPVRRIARAIADRHSRIRDEIAGIERYAGNDLHRAMYDYVDRGSPMFMGNGYSVLNVGGPGETLWARARRAILNDEMSHKGASDLEHANLTEDALNGLARMWLPGGEKIAPEQAGALRGAALQALRNPAVKSFEDFSIHMQHVTGGVVKGVDAQSARALHLGTAAVAHAATMDFIGEVAARELGGTFTSEQVRAANNILAGSYKDVKDFDAGAKVLSSMGIPMASATLRRSRSKADRILMRIAQVGLNTSGNGVFLPSTLAAEFRGEIGNVVKELDAHYQAPGDQAVRNIWKAMRDQFRLVNASVSYGLLVPHPKWFANDLFGTFGQVWGQRGLGEALKQTFQSVPSYIPFVGRGIQDMESAMAASVAKRGKRALPTIASAIMNPHLQAFFSGVDGEIVSRSGRVFRLSDLRKAAVDESVLDAFVHEDLAHILDRGMLRRESGTLGPLWKFARRYTSDRKALGTYVGQRQRALMFLDLVVDKGMKPRDAAKEVRSAMYDWQHSIAPWEAEFMTAIVPYYRYWRLALRQAGEAIMAPLTKPTGEYLPKALAGQTTLANITKMARVSSGMADWDRDSEPEEREVLDAVNDFYGVPFWARGRPHLSPHAIDPEVATFEKHYRGAEYRMSDTVFPSLGLPDAVMILTDMANSLVHGIAAARHEVGYGEYGKAGEALLHYGAESTNSLVGLTTPFVKDAVQMAMSSADPTQEPPNPEQLRPRGGELWLAEHLPGDNWVTLSRTGEKMLTPFAATFMRDLVPLSPELGPILAGTVENPYNDTLPAIQYFFRQVTGIGRIEYSNPLDLQASEVRRLAGAAKHETNTLAEANKARTE